MAQPLCSHAMRDKRKYFMTLIQHAQYLQAGYQGANQWLVCKVSFLKGSNDSVLAFNARGESCTKGLEACPNSRHKSKKAEKQETVIVLLVNMYTYIQLMRQNLKKYI